MDRLYTQSCQIWLGVIWAYSIDIRVHAGPLRLVSASKRAGWTCCGQLTSEDLVHH